MKKLIFRIILLILLENELLYNFEGFSSQFSKQLLLRTLTGWFSICIHTYGVFRFDTICFIKKLKTICGRALFLVKLQMIPDYKTHHISVYSAANKYSSAGHHEQKNKKTTGQIKFLAVAISHRIKLILRHSLCK